MSAAFTGPSDGLGVEVYRGAMAYFTHLNHQGGINGKMVTVQTLDDGYQPDPAIKNTIDFLEESEVLCLFNYVGTPTVTRVLPLLKGYGEYQKLMFFPFTGAEPQRQPPYVDYVFNLRASYRQELSGLVDRFADLGRNRLAVFYQVDAYGRSGWDGARRALAARGLQLASEATYRRGAPFGTSMKQQVEIIMRSNPDAVLSIGSYAACAAFVRDARNMGLDVPIANVSFVGSENLLKLLVAAGEAAGRDYTVDLINTQVVPSYEDVSLPAVREYRDFMDRFMPVPPVLAEKHYTPLRYSFTSFEGFLNAKVMACILKTYDGNPSKGLKHAAESIREADLGIDVPVSFGPERHQGLDRVYFTTVNDRKFVPIDAEQWQTWQK
ncbi:MULTISPECIES: ABC transporter substrate-binding protein [unclassified Pseudodesulfovibrio]|uniref:ABC transporter substrate-binding protein n=1 Tax=unclassified Pseudodesulfovibrio TaxID=2661612 RepID=UPI000FEB91E9|nr:MULTISPECIES: ABC transporter substrate-binding protein [unclassified Pseudodesulfovibrio]MCJ2164446.1 ABC transporter substrate-binding protein [Pseudodesulfovibrio sp. S3-i]RWU04648.1 ABC transporter substrate-binding protein [Pseudodesulfovibrio sp. S3]